MIASNSASSSENDVSMRQWISGCRERISRQTSTPSPSGRRTSNNATSGRDGVEVCREIRSRHPEIHCLMLTSFSDDEALFEAIMAGASGYILKRIKSD